MTKVTITHAAEGNATTETPARAVQAMAEAQTIPQEAAAPSLSDLLNERNEIANRLNSARGDGDPAEFARTSDLESAIVAAPCRSLADAAVKVTLFETIDSEGLIWTGNEAWEMVVGIAPFIRRAARDHAAASAPHFSSEALHDIVAAAKDYDVKFVTPTQKTHNALDLEHAEAKAGPEKERLSAASDAAWGVWEGHCDAYRAIVERILDLAPDTPAALLAQVNTYTELMGVHWARNLRGETPIARLGEDDVAALAEHMHAGLKRLSRLSSDVDTADVQGARSATTSSKLVDPTTPLGQSVARRDQVRADVAAYRNEHGRDAPRDLHKQLGQAEHEVYLTPASTAAEALWKHTENMMEDGGWGSHEEAISKAEETDGLEAAAALGTYRDLLRQAAAERAAGASSAADLTFLKASAEAADHHEQMLAHNLAGDSSAATASCNASGRIIDTLLEQRAQTLGGAMARAHLVERYGPTDVHDDYTDLEWQLVRALIGDVKALFLAQEPPLQVGRDETAAAWLTARMAAYTRGDSYPPPPSMAGRASAPQLLAAE